MSGLSFTTLFPELPAAADVIRDLLDKPAQEFLEEKTITTILTRSFNTVFVQLDITTDNQTQVTDCINAVTCWHVFGAYMSSMSEASQKFEFMNKLKHYKTIAIGLGNLLGIDISGERITIDTTQIIAGGVGMSVYKDTTFFDGAHDNIV